VPKSEVGSYTKDSSHFWGVVMLIITKQNSLVD